MHFFLLVENTAFTFNTSIQTGLNLFTNKNITLAINDHIATLHVCVRFIDKEQSPRYNFQLNLSR